MTAAKDRARSHGDVGKRIARWLVAPVIIAHRRPLQPVLLVTGVLIIAGTAVLVLPPVSDQVVVGTVWPGLRTFVSSHRSGLARWLPFLRLGFEIILAIGVGGSLFGGSLSKKLQSTVERFELRGVA